MNPETDVEALVEAVLESFSGWFMRDAIRDGGLRTALLAAIRDREERARREGHEDAARFVVSKINGPLSSKVALADEIRALSEREEG